MQTVHQSAAWQQGFDAYNAGRLLSDNPFRAGTDEEGINSQQWVYGWTAAAREWQTAINNA